jgi:RNA polymerase sigma-70 factor (ECF subfamily)
MAGPVSVARRAAAAGRGQSGLSVTEVVEARRAFVERTLRRCGVPEADIADAAQDVFIVVFRRLAEYDDAGNVTAWLYSICLRLASDYRRRIARRREALMAELPEMFSAVAGQAEVVEQEQLRRRLSEVLNGLHPTQREVFLLYEAAGCPMKEIARRLSCPLQTAYYRLHAARRSVQDAFDDQVFELQPRADAA